MRVGIMSLKAGLQENWERLTMKLKAIVIRGLDKQE